MGNPWTQIDINTYEKHMSLDNVYQLQTMNRIMKSQFCTYPVSSVMILGIAGGNGLEHIDPDKIDKVYGVDINENYLNICKQRYPELEKILHTLCVDLTEDASQLPNSDLVIANLLIEYIGYERFKNILDKVNPKYVSCVIQVNGDNSFVSDSPFIHEFDRLDEVAHLTEENILIEKMKSIDYNFKKRYESQLPNGKKLVRIDFVR